MNERIKEIALESWAYVSYNDAPKGILKRDWYDQKFAELIVNECVAEAKDDCAGWSERDQCLVMQVMDRIKQHFGIR